MLIFFYIVYVLWLNNKTIQKKCSKKFLKTSHITCLHLKVINHQFGIFNRKTIKLIFGNFVFYNMLIYFLSLKRQCDNL